MDGAPRFPFVNHFQHANKKSHEFVKKRARKNGHYQVMDACELCDDDEWILDDCLQSDQVLMNIIMMPITEAATIALSDLIENANGLLYVYSQLLITCEHDTMIYSITSLDGTYRISLERKAATFFSNIIFHCDEHSTSNRCEMKHSKTYRMPN